MSTITVNLKDHDAFVVTGKTTDGKRFSMRYPATASGFHTAMNINLFAGTVWSEKNGKRTILKRVSA